MTYREQYKYWCTSPYFNETTQTELKTLTNEAEIEDRFYKELEFGTGGIRGILGAGTNRMNIYTVRKATQGLANYIINQDKKDSQKIKNKGVAIAYDSRRMSPEFADETALCLAANGIKAYVFESLRPTPELSFALRKLNCIAGIVITASHNPPEYNGYKAYWEDGAQMTYPHDEAVIAEVRKVTDFDDVKTMPKEEAIKAGLYITIGSEIDDAYISELKKQIINHDVIKKAADKIKIVFSPFNGSGNILVRRILSELGFKNVYVVPEQELPDPDFTTLDYPNPEDPKAFTLALKLAKEKGADIILATDPDADRLGIYAYDKESNDFIPFTGNMSGMLIAEYILRERTKTKTMPPNPVLISTIVTTNMAAQIANDYNVKFIETLTGFKFIGEQIKLFEQNGRYNFVFGLEESYGCLAGTHSRDKDAIVAVMCLCEMAAYCMVNNKTVWDQMLEIYQKYGFYKESQYAITLKGIEGSKQIQEMMDKLRTKPPKEFGELKVKKFRDYENNLITDFESGTHEASGLPKSNVLYFDLENDSWCCARPSGTEPKIKFYMGIKGSSLTDADARIERLTKAIKAIL